MDLQLYEGSVQEGEQLYWKVSLVRLGYDPNDADAWVEEPVTDPDDANEFEMDGEILPLRLRLLTEKGRVPKRQSAKGEVPTSQWVGPNLIFRTVTKAQYKGRVKAECQVGEASATDSSQVVFQSRVYSYGLLPAFHTATVPPLFCCGARRPIGHDQACYCCGEGLVAVRVVPQKSIACFRNKTEDLPIVSG